ncbi:MAG: SipW-dependent-type signal peptide-containing protein [Acutalibacteraceae bacterium]
MKRKILAGALALGMLALSALGTAAYFTSEDTATNVITAGNIKIELNETALSEGQAAPLPFEDKIRVLPDTGISKIVTVKNTGEHPAYIRISVEKQIILPDGTEGDTSLTEADFNTEYWTEREGFWYYNKCLEAGCETEPLFTCVTFAGSMDNRYQNSTATLTVKAFGIQSENNGSDPLKAVGWPETK